MIRLIVLQGTAVHDLVNRQDIGTSALGVMLIKIAYNQIGGFKKD